MADKTIRLSYDFTSPSYPVDLSLGPTGMELGFAEIEAFRGDNLTIQFPITQNGRPFDLTGYTIKFQAKEAFDDTSFAFDKTCSLVGAATAGICQVALTGGDLVTAGNYFAQLYLTTTGVTQSVFQCPLVIHPSV